MINHPGKNTCHESVRWPRPMDRTAEQPNNPKGFSLEVQLKSKRRRTTSKHPSQTKAVVPCSYITLFECSSCCIWHNLAASEFLDTYMRISTLSMKSQYFSQENTSQQYMKQNRITSKLCSSQIAAEAIEKFALPPEKLALIPRLLQSKGTKNETRVIQ